MSCTATTSRPIRHVPVPKRANIARTRGFEPSCQTARPGNGTGAGEEVSILVPELRYSGVMTESRDLTVDSHLEPDELVWLEERLVEYREMLEYLRLH